MREIKLRAFLNSKYYDNPCMLSWEELLAQYDAIDMFETDLMTLMQYTGLHDKNGREIYEGDIVKVFDDDGDSFVSEISWQKDYPAFDLVRWPNHYYDSNALSAIVSGETEQTMEVVGNVYENPELLEAEK